MQLFNNLKRSEDHLERDLDVHLRGLLVALLDVLIPDEGEHHVVDPQQRDQRQGGSGQPVLVVVLRDLIGSELLNDDAHYVYEYAEVHLWKVFTKQLYI